MNNRVLVSAVRAVPKDIAKGDDERRKAVIETIVTDVKKSNCYGPTHVRWFTKHPHPSRNSRPARQIEPNDTYHAFRKCLSPIRFMINRAFAP